MSRSRRITRDTKIRRAIAKLAKVQRARRAARVLALLALVGCMPTERQLRIAGVAAVNAAIACDVGQTIYESDGGAWDRPGPAPHTHLQEMNPFIGPTPPVGQLVVDGGLAGAVTAWIGLKAPRWAAWSYLGIVGAAEVFIVADHVKWGGRCGV